jgi:hypothetical protein
MPIGIHDVTAFTLLGSIITQDSTRELFSLTT